MPSIDKARVKRARDYGWVPKSSFKVGQNNAITDVAGVLVGHTTLIRGDPGELQLGHGPIRTGVTAIRPHPGNTFTNRVAAGVYVFNGYGKTIGLEQIRFLGNIETPILLTNTFNIWRCADFLLDWVIKDNPEIGVTAGSLNPIVGEAFDGWLNDIQGRHVTKDHVFFSLDNAKSGFVNEGGVGAGTGMICYDFKSGIGTASRKLPVDLGGFTIGVLVLTNFGFRNQLIIQGCQVGLELVDWPRTKAVNFKGKSEGGSCMVIVATDAPLSSRQLVRIATRAPLGLARTGFTSTPGSGDYVISFSTTNRILIEESIVSKEMVRVVDQGKTMSMIFQAVVEATEESVLNSLVAGKTIEGRDGHIAYGIPIDLINEHIIKNPQFHGDI
jgi:D-aminopeptidase